MGWFFNLSMWQGSVLVLGGAMAICAGGHLLADRFGRKASKPQTELPAALMGVVAAFIGIMLAFAAVQVWDDYQHADDAVAHEAATISQLYRDLAVYGDDTLSARQGVATYVRLVVDDEWPRLARGEPSPAAVGALIQVFRDAAKLEPKTNRETVMFGEIFGKLNQVVEYRRARMIASRAELPALFWAVALVGSAVMVAYTFVFPATPLNLACGAGLGLSLGLIFLFILNVNHPFAGAYAVDHRELSDLLPLFEKISAPSP